MFFLRDGYILWEIPDNWPGMVIFADKNSASMDKRYTPHQLVQPLAAEWETDGTVLLAWPHADTDWNYMLPEVTDCYRRLVQALVPWHRVLITAPDCTVPKRILANAEGTEGRVYYADIPGNDTWARDFGPLTVRDAYGQPHVVDYQFNGWGLKFAADLDNLVTLRLCERKVITAPRLNRLGFTLEGGSIDSDGAGTILTTSRCLLSPDRNGDLNREEIEAELYRTLGADRVLWLEHGALAGDDTDSHIDTLARFAPGDTIVYVGCDDPKDANYAELQAMEEELRGLRTRSGQPYNLVRLPSPNPVIDPDEGIQLPATYANYLVTAKGVFMPMYGEPETDLLAAQTLVVAYGRRVTGVDCRALVRQHGSLHCVTMMLPDEILSF